MSEVVGQVQRKDALKEFYQDLTGQFKIESKLTERGKDLEGTIAIDQKTQIILHTIIQDSPKYPSYLWIHVYSHEAMEAVQKSLAPWENRCPGYFTIQIIKEYRSQKQSNDASAVKKF